MNQFHIVPDNRRDLLALLRDAGGGPVSPCGGNGTCGKCKVYITSGASGALSESEKSFLSESEIGSGCRLACTIIPEEPLDVLVPYSSAGNLGKGSWEKDFTVFAGEHDSWIKRISVELDTPSMESQQSELSRLRECFPGTLLRPDLRILTELADSLKPDNRRINLVINRDTGNREWIVSVNPGNHSDRLYGCAVDIGTTTVAVYLADLEMNAPFDSLSRSNTQAEYGADVISRIGSCMEHGIDRLSSTIREQLRDMISLISRRNGIGPDEIYRISIVGNTTMIHLLTGTDPSGIAMAPFIPVFTEELYLQASTLELGVHSAAEVHIVPAISAYVGADIVAGILASGIMDFSGSALFLDIGTNGEIVLKHQGRYWACSTAAGPAFEGARIRWGTGGENGAIDSFAVVEDGFRYTTIGNEPPVGICGAGIVDIVSVLLRYGIIDRKGKLKSAVELHEDQEAEAETIERFRTSLSIIDGKPVFIVASKTGTAVQEEIYISRKDVREVQLAKAAIAAGIESLLISAGISLVDIDKIFLAGGFGSYVKKESAAAIGLIPADMADKTEVVGNAAGKGALHALFSRKQSMMFNKISEQVSYIELSGNADFNKLFMDHMKF